MTRVFFGKKAGFGPVMKIMADDSDNPLTTANTAYGKFNFNSETGAYAYISEVYSADITWTELALGYRYYPTGASTTSPLRVGLVTAGASKYLEATLNPGYSDYSTLSKKISWVRLFVMPTGVLPGANLTQRKANVDAAEAWTSMLEYSQTGVNGKPLLYAPEFWIADAESTVTWFAGDPPGFGTGNVACRAQLFISDLPGDGTAYLTPGTPVAGQKVLVFNKTTAKMARPGYTTAHTGDKLIFDSDRSPMKIAGTGYVASLAAGATWLAPATAFPISHSSLVMGLFTPVGVTLLYPPQLSTEASVEGFMYRIRTVSGVNRVEFKNGGAVAVAFRYAIMSEDSEPVTSGSAKVIETGANFFRIIRPGASSSPTSRDVLIDSRTVAMPLVAQGNLGSGSMVASDDATLGSHMFVVNYSNDGTWKPYPVAMARIVSKNPATLGDISYRRFLMHWVKWKDPDGSAADSFLCKVTDTQTKFYGWMDTIEAALRVSRTGASTYTYTYDHFDGVRYYIFALPV